MRLTVGRYSVGGTLGRNWSMTSRVASISSSLLSTSIVTYSRGRIVPAFNWRVADSPTMGRSSANSTITKSNGWNIAAPARTRDSIGGEIGVIVKEDLQNQF